MIKLRKYAVIGMYIIYIYISVAHRVIHEVPQNLLCSKGLYLRFLVSSNNDVIYVDVFIMGRKSQYIIIIKPPQ